MLHKLETNHNVSVIITRSNLLANFNKRKSTDTKKKRVINIYSKQGHKIKIALSRQKTKLNFNRNAKIKKEAREWIGVAELEDNQTRNL